MKIKDGANIERVRLSMQPVFVEAEAIWRNHGHELVITCGLDGEHSAGSLHYYGLAVDCRTNYFNPDVAAKVAKELQDALGADYDVVLEATHIHVEYDVG